jgi:NAD(P)H-dependent FMN reductase
MITVISGTNRPGSRTLLFSTHYLRQLRELGQEAQLLDLAEMRLEHYAPNMYDAKAMSAELRELQNRFVISAKKMVIFVPEYNGSYPGVLKLFLDGISINEYPRNFKGKHIALVGVASGRAGNLRGMDHLATAINHMGGWVLPNKLPISNADKLLDANNQVTDAETITALENQARQLIDA